MPKWQFWLQISTLVRGESGSVRSLGVTAIQWFVALRLNAGRHLLVLGQIIKTRYFDSLGACLVEEDGSGWLHGERQALQSLQVEAVDWEDWGGADCV